MPITPPIFVQGDELYIFTSVAEAESYLEPVDVEPGERGYDSEGRRLRVVVRGEVERAGSTIDLSRAWVELLLEEEVPSHAEELRAVLGDWLARAERVATSPTTSLPDLVARARKHALGSAAIPRARLKWGKVILVIVALGILILMWAAR